jgi:hypothetical protein
MSGTQQETITGVDKQKEAATPCRSGGQVGGLRRESGQTGPVPLAGDPAKINQCRGYGHACNCRGAPARLSVAPVPRGPPSRPEPPAPSCRACAGFRGYGHRTAWRLPGCDYRGPSASPAPARTAEPDRGSRSQVGNLSLFDNVMRRLGFFFLPLEELLDQDAEGRK